jgi:ubiquinone/menaquinone biosynthesis C-methylase UbiE
LLDVACGTGRHLEFLSTSMQCVGVDIEPALLVIAQRRCPTVTFAPADMRALDLGRTFDVVTCLFSSIGYMATAEDLHQSIRSMSSHLRPGGLLIIEPWFHPETWTAGRTQVAPAP